MRRPDDNLLMSFADGALDGRDKAEVEATLRRDVNARRRVAMFLLTDEVARLAFDEPMWADTPPRLLQVLLQGQGINEVDAASTWQLIGAHTKRLVRMSFTCACLISAAAIVNLTRTATDPDSASATYSEPSLWQSSRVKRTSVVPARLTARAALSALAIRPAINTASNLKTELESRMV